MILDDNQEMPETLKSILSGTAVYVLMEITMRSIEGLRAARILLKEFPDAKVVIVSQYDGEEIRFEAKQAGSVGYVLKESLNKVLKILQ